MGIAEWKYTNNPAYGRTCLWCRYCKKYKRRTSFSAWKNSKTGRSEICKSCDIKKKKRWRKLNPERYKAKCRAKDKRTVDEKHNDYFRAIDDLVGLGKGRRDDPWFYRMFPNKGKLAGMPDTVEEIQEKIRSAWWVEEEDIYQHLLICTWKTKITSRALYHNTYYFLAHDLRDYLLAQQVFSRQVGWEGQYKHHLETVMSNNKECINASLAMLFNSFKWTLLRPFDASWFGRYLIYLSYVAHETHNVIGERILYTRRPTVDIFNELRRRLEEYNVKAENTGGYSIPIFTRREIH